MLRKIALSLLIMSVALLGVAANKKKGKGGSTTTTVATSTATIQASEGTTAMAIRGIVEPVDGAVVIGFTGGVFTARDRVTGRIAKFTAPAGSNLKVGTEVKIDFSGKVVQTPAGRFEISNETPCCTITAINWGDHTITVKEPAVGRSFVMKAEPTNDMKVGQAVEANFKMGTAWISGNSALKGTISNLSQPTALHP